MFLGIVHYTFLVGAILLLIAAFNLFMYYRSHRLRLTLLFIVFILSFVVVGFANFTRGLFTILTPESIMLYKTAMVFMCLGTAFLTTFLLYTLILQQRNKHSTRYWLTTGTLLLVWVLAVVSVSMLVLGATTVSFVSHGFEVYTTTFGPVPYIGILVGPMVSAFLSLGIMIVMAIRESSKFYKTRAIILSCGWLLAIFGELVLLSEQTAILNAILVPLGITLMTMGIMRRASTA